MNAWLERSIELTSTFDESCARTFSSFSEEAAFARSDSFGSIELGRVVRRRNDSAQHDNQPMQNSHPGITLL